MSRPKPGGYAVIGPLRQLRDQHMAAADAIGGVARCGGTMSRDLIMAQAASSERLHLYAAAELGRIMDVLRRAGVREE